MPSPDPARIDALLGGDAPRDAEERGLAELVTELRATEGASDALRARVTALTTPAPAAPARRGLLARLRGTTWGRVALVAAPVCAVAIVAVVSVRAFSGGDEAVPPVAATGAVQPSTATAEGAAATDTLTTAPSARLATGVSVTLALPAGVDLDIAGARTRRIAEDLGGLAASERYEVTPGAGGTAVLTLRIPSGRLDDARAQLARLGAVRRQTLDYVTPPPAAAPPAAAPPAAAPAPTSTPAAPADGLVTVRVTLRAR